MVALTPLVLWGLALGAWAATALTAVGAGLLGWGKRPRLGLLIAGLVVAVGTPEVLWCVDGIGARARQGELGLRDQVAVYGFNVVFGMAAHVVGFGAFGWETMALGVPWSAAGPCSSDRLARYGRHLPRAYAGHHPRLRRWTSAMPMRAERIRRVVRGWAETLPDEAGAPRQFDRVPIKQWHSADYVSPAAANQVAIALSTPTTGMSGRAEFVDGAWRLDVSLDLALAYPERSTLQIGPFGLEEGMFHDARGLLQPYCLEYRWQVSATDPALHAEGPRRAPLERLSTWTLRQLGARYR